MSQVADRIIETQEAVDRYEALSADQRDGTADEALLAGYEEVALGGDFPDLLTFTGEVYHWIRRIEAVAHARKSEIFRGVIWNRAYGFVDWAWLWGDPIAAKLRYEVPHLEPKSELEQAGKLWIEQTLRWALGRLNAFRDWGYE
jgi:hypothetical protein